MRFTSVAALCCLLLALCSTGCPTPKPAAAPNANLALLVDGGGIWVGGAGGTRFVAHCADGAVDVAAVVDSLCAVASAPMAPGLEHKLDMRARAVDLAADGVPYGRVVAVLDALKVAGLRNVALVSPQSLSVPLATGAPPQGPPAAPKCGERARACDEVLRAAGNEGERTAAHVVMPKAASGVALDEAQSILVITISTSDIYVGADHVASLKDLAGQAAPGAPIAPLQARLLEMKRARAAAVDAGRVGAAHGELVVALHVDQSVPASVITRVLDTCTTAGITRLSFALAVPPPEPSSLPRMPPPPP